jgi:hypothetical protein
VVGYQPPLGVGCNANASFFLTRASALISKLTLDVVEDLYKLQSPNIIPIKIDCRFSGEELELKELKVPSPPSPAGSPCHKKVAAVPRERRVPE